MKDESRINTGMFLDYNIPGKIEISENPNDSIKILFFKREIILTKYKISYKPYSLILSGKSRFWFNIEELNIKRGKKNEYELFIVLKGDTSELLEKNKSYEDLENLKKIIEDWIEMLPEESLNIDKIHDFSVLGLKNNVVEREKDKINIDLSSGKASASAFQNPELIGVVLSAGMIIYVIFITNKNIDFSTNMLMIFGAIAFFIFSVFRFFTAATYKITLNKSFMSVTVSSQVKKDVIDINLKEVKIIHLNYKKHSKMEIWYIVIEKPDGSMITVLKNSDVKLLRQIQEIINAWVNYYEDKDNINEEDDDFYNF